MKEPCDDPYALCVEALRRGIGPKAVWLACQGHYSGPEAAVADAARIGLLASAGAPDPACVPKSPPARIG